MKGILLCVAAVAALPIGSATPNVAGALAIAHRNAKSQQADKFASTVATPNIEGEEFSVSYGLSDGSASGIDAVQSGYYTYLDGEFSVSFSTDQAGYDPANLKAIRAVAFFQAKHVVGGRYSGENAFGVTRVVTRYSIARNGIAFLGGRLGEVGKQEFSTPLSGPEARRLARDLRVQITGSVARLPSGKLTECKEKYRGPTLNYPVAATWKDCWVGALVRRVALIDSKDGRTLRAWE